MICRLWVSQLQFCTFTKEKSTQIQKPILIDDTLLPVSSVDIPIFKNPQTKFWKIEIIKVILISWHFVNVEEMLFRIYELFLVYVLVHTKFKSFPKRSYEAWRLGKLGE